MAKRVQGARGTSDGRSYAVSSKTRRKTTPTDYSPLKTSKKLETMFEGLRAD